MQELVERMLGVRTRFAPDHRSGGALHRLATATHGLAVALHLQLLQVCWQAMQVLIVGQHCVTRGAQEVAVPDARKRQQDREVAIQRSGAEVLVHLVCAGQKIGEVPPADGQGKDKTHCGADRIASANPVPEAQPTVRRHSEIVHRTMIRGYRHELRGHRNRASPVQQPFANPPGIGQCLRRRKRLGADHEQRRFRIHGPQDAVQLYAVDVRYEVNAESGPAISVKGLQRHHDTQIGAADADVDDVGDFPPRVTRQRTAVKRICQSPHLFSFGLHTGHDIVAVHRQRAIGGTAKCDVQGGAVLGVVDALAAEHALDPVRQASLFGQPQQQRQGPGIEPLPAEIQPQPFGFGAQQATATGFPIEERRDGHAIESTGALPEGSPGTGAGSVSFFAHR